MLLLMLVRMIEYMVPFERHMPDLATHLACGVAPSRVARLIVGVVVVGVVATACVTAATSIVGLSTTTPGAVGNLVPSSLGC